MYCSPTPVSPCVYFYITDIIRKYMSFHTQRSSHLTYIMNLLVTKCSLNLLAFPSTKSSPLFDTCENRSIWALIAKMGGSHGSHTRLARKRGGAIIPRFCPARETTWSTKRLRSGRRRNKSHLFVSCIFGCIHQMRESRCTARLGHANAVCKSKNEETNA